MYVVRVQFLSSAVTIRWQVEVKLCSKPHLVLNSCSNVAVELNVIVLVQLKIVYI